VVVRTVFKAHRVDPRQQKTSDKMEGKRRGRGFDDHKIPQYKLLLIGETAVGKSCLLLRLAEDSFTHSFMPTIGIDFKNRNINLDGEEIQLQVWDTAGQERFRTITTAYYRGAQGIMLVFDVTDQKSFDKIGYWMETTRKHAHDGVNLLLVGNKCDRQDKRVVDTDRAKKLAEKYGLAYFETSAKTGQSVDEAFMHLARDVRRRQTEKKEALEDQPAKGFVLGASGGQSGGGTGGSSQKPAGPGGGGCPC